MGLFQRRGKPARERAIADPNWNRVRHHFAESEWPISDHAGAITELDPASKRRRRQTRRLHQLAALRKFTGELFEVAAHRGNFLSRSCQLGRALPGHCVVLLLRAVGQDHVLHRFLHLRRRPMTSLLPKMSKPKPETGHVAKKIHHRHIGAVPAERRSVYEAGTASPPSAFGRSPNYCTELSTGD